MEVVEEEIKIKICFFVCESNSKHLNQKGRVRLHELHSPGLKHSVMAAPAESSQALLLCLFGRHNFPDLPAKGADGGEGGGTLVSDNTIFPPQPPQKSTLILSPLCVHPPLLKGRNTGRSEPFTRCDREAPEELRDRLARVADWTRIWH